MIRWLDPLGWFKWPSLALIVSPLVAYSFWLPEPKPAAYCGMMLVEGRPFTVHRMLSGNFHLRLAEGDNGSKPLFRNTKPIGFDSGDMVMAADDPSLGRSNC